MTFEEFINTKYYSALDSVCLPLTEWIEYISEEKASDKAKELIGGYLKKHDYKDACAVWWGKLTKENKDIIKSMPNFDAYVFFDITGVRV